MSIQDLEILKAACCVAGLDGDISDREKQTLQVLAKRAGVGKASFEAMIEVAVEDEDYFKKQLDLLRGDTDRTIKTLFQIAVTDRKLGANERIVMQYFADKLEMPPERFEKILAAAERSV
ncbi:MAG: hypothetical protein O7G85_11395 [Planctomycetota bacterium]|nr:hypothetical protein [Planctomycetota bacterium]